LLVHKPLYISDQVKSTFLQQHTNKDFGRLKDKLHRGLNSGNKDIGNIFVQRRRLNLNHFGLTPYIHQECNNNIQYWHKFGVEE
jgi:hypothetical protein